MDPAPRLNANEARVIGVLVETEVTISRPGLQVGAWPRL